MSLQYHLEQLLIKQETPRLAISQLLVHFYLQLVITQLYNLIDLLAVGHFHQWEYLVLIYVCQHVIVEDI